MKNKIILLMVVTAMLVPLSIAQNISLQDESAIKKPALDYIEGWYMGDASRMERALHPEPHRTRRFEMIWAVDTNSTDEVGLGADQLGHQLACAEVWGGNNTADELVNLPGLVGLIHSKLDHERRELLGFIGADVDGRTFQEFLVPYLCRWTNELVCTGADRLFRGAATEGVDA